MNAAEARRITAENAKEPGIEHKIARRMGDLMRVIDEKESQIEALKEEWLRNDEKIKKLRTPAVDRQEDKLRQAIVAKSQELALLTEIPIQERQKTYKEFQDQAYNNASAKLKEVRGIEDRNFEIGFVWQRFSFGFICKPFPEPRSGIVDRLCKESGKAWRRLRFWDWWAFTHVACIREVLDQEQMDYWYDVGYDDVLEVAKVIVSHFGDKT